MSRQYRRFWIVDDQGHRWFFSDHGVWEHWNVWKVKQNNYTTAMNLNGLLKIHLGLLTTSELPSILHFAWPANTQSKHNLIKSNDF